MKVWVENLSAEDLAFVKRFILASGSLKEVARIYGISYPTVRLRLDRLIAKISVLDELEDSDEFERVVRALYADGRVDEEALRLLLKTHRENAGENE